MQIPIDMTIQKNTKGLLKNIQNYNKLVSSLHYDVGFRDLLKTILEENQYLTNIYFNSDSDVFTYNVETYTPEQIKENEINNEFNFYQQRQTSGLNLYLKHEAEYRIMFLNDAITKDEFNIIEETLKPVRLELGFGQLKSAFTLLKEIPATRIGVDIYNAFYLDLETLINELYLNQ